MFDRRGQGVAVDGGQHDAVDGADDEVLHNLDLSFAVAGAVRAGPEDLDSGFSGGLFGACFDVAPEVAGVFGDHGDRGHSGLGNPFPAELYNRQDDQEDNEELGEHLQRKPFFVHGSYSIVILVVLWCETWSEQALACLCVEDACRFMGNRVLNGLLLVVIVALMASDGNAGLCVS